MNDLLEKTLSAATKDPVSVTEDGKPIRRLLDGMTLRPTTLHVDERGSLFEIFHRGWGIDEHPAEQVYCATVRPGVVKGWALHKHHDDRYFLISGELQVVLYDVRPDSSTRGQLLKITLSEQDRHLLTIPAHVWHADHNIGSRDAVLVNMPTVPYDPNDPDKYRLPVDTPLIPHDFGGARGG